MRNRRIAFILLLLLPAWGGAAFPSEGGPSGLGVGSGLVGEPGRAPTSPECGCADLAYTETFKSRKLEYVCSREFAEAVSAVASGESTYSPPEIPREWKAAAPGSVSSCDPVLVYLASLEYRSRTGLQGIVPTFPHVVRTASGEIQARVAAKKRMAPVFERRVAVIGAKVLEAQRMGAQECQPSELARVKDALESARRAAVENRFDIRETEEELARADLSAESLLAKRQYAAARGIRCFPE